MSRIDDFGEHLAGAAKDDPRRAIIERDGLPSGSLARDFPEPKWGKLIEQGMDTKTLSLLRGVRDALPARRSSTRSNGVMWDSTVIALARATHEMTPETSRTDLMVSILNVAETHQYFRRGEEREDLYRRLGHERSLRDYSLVETSKTSAEGHPLFEIRKHNSQKRARWIIARDSDPDEAARRLSDHLTREEIKADQKKNALSLYTYRTDPETYWIGKKVKGRQIDLASFDSESEARIYARDNRDALLAQLEEAKKTQRISERRENNRERQGPARRTKSVTPEDFMETFGFRGVQFGNSVTNRQRQERLDQTWDALHDMADILDCSPRAMSLDGSLGLAFGARGKGGIRSGVAHYEPDGKVINLTREKGAGSLAHEWFHGLDNALSTNSWGYATQSQFPSPARAMIESLFEETDLRARSMKADQQEAGKAYYVKTIEIAARSFEAWVIDRLESRGMQNDFLANIAFEPPEGADFLGMRGDTYIYPKAVEIGRVDTAFAALFETEEIRSIIGRAPAPAPEPARPEVKENDPFRAADEAMEAPATAEDPETEALQRKEPASSLWDWAGFECPDFD